MAPGPPKAIGKGLFTNGFTAMLLVERFAAGRSMSFVVTGLARHGAGISPATLAGTAAQAAGLLVPLAEAIAERNRESWHFHADETTWRVFCPGGGKGPAKWWLWVFIGADTVCFVMDPSRSGAVLARHAGIDEKTGKLLPAADGGPRRLVISSDFYAVYQSAGRKADGLVNLYCAAHIRRHMVRAGDASPVQLKYWTQNWLDLFRDLYRAHDKLMAAWQEAAAPPAREKKAAAERLENAYGDWDTAIGVIDETRKKQMQAPGLREPAKKALATLDREWDGLIAHRGYPMISLDNNLAERTIRGPVVTRQERRGSHNGQTAKNAAYLDRHRDGADGRAEPAHLPDRLPRRMRPQRRKAAHREGTGTVPALEGQPRGPPRLGPAAPARIRTRTRNAITGAADDDRHAGHWNALSQHFRILTAMHS